MLTVSTKFSGDRCVAVGLLEQEANPGAIRLIGVDVELRVTDVLYCCVVGSATPERLSIAVDSGRFAGCSRDRGHRTGTAMHSYKRDWQRLRGSGAASKFRHRLLLLEGEE